MGSDTISIMGGPSLTEETTEGRTECCLGVRGDESTAEAGDASEYDGEGPRAGARCSVCTDVASESIVYSDGARVFFLTGVDVLLGCRMRAGLAVLVLIGRGGGDFARMVLGWEPAVDVISVLS